MNKSIWKILSSVTAIIMAAISLIAFFAIDACPMIETAAGGSVPMKCHWAFTAESWIGLIGITTGLLCATAKTMEGRRIAALTTLVVAVIVIMILTPAGIGICAHDDSSCHGPAYAIWALSAVGAILSIVLMAKADPTAAEKPKMTI